MTREEMEVEISMLRANLAASKGELEALKSDIEKFTLERRRDRVLEVALRLYAADAQRGAIHPMPDHTVYVHCASIWIAEVERQVTP